MVVVCSEWVRKKIRVVRCCVCVVRGGGVVICGVAGVGGGGGVPVVNDFTLNVGECCAKERLAVQ